MDIYEGKVVCDHKENEVKKHEESGIIFFDEPYKTKMMTFLVEHLNCDYIFKDRDFDEETEVIVAYASAEKYNRRLREIREIDFPQMQIQLHVGEWMINGI